MNDGVYAGARTIVAKQTTTTRKMIFLIVLKVALRSLRRTLLRSGLTALGIIIGVAAVIAMVSIGNGARAQVEQMLASLDSNLLVFVARPPEEQVRLRMGRMFALGMKDGLNIEDYNAIREQIDGIAAASVRANASVGEAKANGRGSEASVTGLDAEGFEVLSRRVVSGATFGENDVSAAASVCLISETVAATLFPDRNPEGQTLRLKEVPFVVIGVVADQDARGNPFQSQSGDTSVYVPYTSLLRRLSRNAQMAIALKAQDPAQLSVIQQQVSDLLEARRGKRKAQFRSDNVAEAVRATKEGSETLTLLLGAIGGISLLVGGIGIMNIMLVSVTERTREIGIRLAIGTRARDVLRQFLIEAAILSVLGGTLGILLGIGAAYLITWLNQWPTEITSGSVLAAFLCSAAIGVFFGYYPARQAAGLDPIQALRAE